MLCASAAECLNALIRLPGAFRHPEIPTWRVGYVVSIRDNKSELVSECYYAGHNQEAQRRNLFSQNKPSREILWFAKTKVFISCFLDAIHGLLNSKKKTLDLDHFLGPVFYFQ